MKNPLLIVLLCSVLTQSHVRSQTTPFLTDERIRMLVNQISGDRAFEHIRWLSHWHRDSGMEGYFKAAEYVVQAAKEAGLEDVKFIEQPRGERNYTPKAAELWMIEPVEVKLADIAEHATYLADGSHNANVTAELVWIGSGSAEELKGVNVAGKIVLTNGSPNTAAYRAVWEKGAVGVVSFQTSEGRSPLDVPDQIAWNRISLTPPQGKQGTFAFMLPARKGEALQRILESDQPQDFLATGKRTKGGRVVLRATVEVEITPGPGRTGFVEGWIRGTGRHDQQIVLTAHLQEEQGSANDDGSGCANLLELGRAMNALIKAGKIQRPLRDLRFWWTDEIYSEYRYFRDNPAEPGKMLANIHQDMVGARQSQGSRVQHLIYAPSSRTSYLDAMLESIGTYVIRTNNAYLAASRLGGLPRPHTRPIYSTRGTREGYTAAFVPYFGQSDYMCFLEGIIGVPAVGLINWDDSFIHSSDDDLDKIDQTQLRRNCFIVGGIASVLAYATPRDVPVIAGETIAQGLRRLANDMHVAMQIVRNGDLAREQRWKQGSIIIEQGIVRERSALRSIGPFLENDAAAGALVEAMVSRLAQRQQEMMNDLREYYRNVCGTPPGSVTLTTEETVADRRIPVNVPSLDEYFANRDKVSFPHKLRGLMKDEVYNFVDGRRSCYDIYKAVWAEAQVAGEWYYGTVSLEGVVGLLNAAVEGKALSWKP